MNLLTKICTVARIAPEKGQVFAMEVARKLVQRGWRFRWTFVGDGPDMAQCRQLVNEYGLQKVVEFVGAQSNPYPFIAQADVYVSPSNVEADPITIQEALVLNTPIVASDINAHREALLDGKLGVIAPLEAEKFADAIMALAESPQAITQLKEAMKNRVSRNQIAKERIDQLLGL